MDGYIKNKREAIAAVRKTIFLKYTITFLIVLFIPVWLLGLLCNQPPQKWTHTEITFSHLSEERIGLQRLSSDMLNTQDGRKFVIATKFEKLVPGNTYSLVYSNTVAGGDHVKALYDESTVFQALDDSILRWEHEQRECVAGLIVTIIIEIIALILIDRLWCKTEYAKIQKLKSDIKHREERIGNCNAPGF